MEMYQSTRAAIIDLLKDKRHYGKGPNGEERFLPKLLVCGHSMGGALARLCALDLVVSQGIPAEQVSLVSFGSGPIGNRAFSKLLDLLFLRRDLHFVNDRDPVPSLGLALSEGGILPDALSTAFLRGSFSFSGCKIWFTPNDGSAFEPCQEWSPVAAAVALVQRLVGLVLPTGNAVEDHSTVNYIRKVATCALAAGVDVESTFAGSASLAPPPFWAQPLLLAADLAPAAAPAVTAAAQPPQRPK
jgi:hypothetical protein